MARLGYGARVGALLVGLVMSLGALAPAASASTPMGNGGPVWSDPVAYTQTAGVLLQTISCSSKGNCVAVGGGPNDAGTGLVPVAAVETNGTWGAANALPLPADATAAGGLLNGLACTSASSCVAVGAYQVGGGPVGLVIPLTVSGGTATSSGATAVMTSGPGAHELPNSLLNGVSCSAADQCVAVGQYIDDATHKGLAMTVVPDGSGTWSALGTTAPAAATGGSALNAISCAPGGACQAMGLYTDSAGGEFPWTDRVAGGVAGTGVDVPMPSDYFPGPPAPGGNAGVPAVAIACPSSDACTAALSYIPNTGVPPAPKPIIVPVAAGAPGSTIALGGNGILSSISCLDVNTCMVSGVGLSVASIQNGGSGYFARESGGTWSSPVMPHVPSLTFVLSSVACTSAVDCTAVGWQPDLSNPNVAASFFFYSASPLTVNTSSLPAATVGTPYRATLSATGGNGPDSWSISAGSLPDGLSLDPSTGVISGTPTTAGRSGFAATVTQAGPPDQTQTISPSITVSRATPHVKISGVKSKLKRKSFLHGLKVKLAPSEPVSLQVSLVASAKKATIARAFNLTLATRNLGLSGSSRTVKLVPKKKLVGKAKRFKVRLVVVATDSGGGRVTETKTLLIKG